LLQILIILHAILILCNMKKTYRKSSRLSDRRLTIRLSLADDMEITKIAAAQGVSPQQVVRALTVHSLRQLNGDD
jgi:predicted DNA binding CopG/RHH family protein